MKKMVLLILLAIFVFGSIGAVAAHQTDFIDLSPVFAKIPFLQGLVKQPADNPAEVLVSPIEEENKQLRADKSELLSRITRLEDEKTALLEQVTELQESVNQFTVAKKESESREANARELAEYYREMEPEATVRIMENLDDETVLLILPLLDKKLSGEIISLMDPQRAALLTALLLEKSS